MQGAVHPLFAWFGDFVTGFVVGSKWVFLCAHKAGKDTK